MSSVCAKAVRFGVSGVTFHGIGLRHIGMPSMMLLLLPPPGPNTMTSYFAFRFASLATSCVLMYVYGMALKSNA